MTTSNFRIAFTRPDGGVSIIHPQKDESVEAALRCVDDYFELAGIPRPEDVVVKVISPEALPSDRSFRNAWELQGEIISENLVKSQTLAHEERRKRRSEELAPLDIKATIPKEATAAEQAREVIRQKYAALQTQIDAAQSVEELKAILT